MELSPQRIVFAYDFRADHRGHTVGDSFDHDAARRSVLAVGPAGGRGFVVEIDDKLHVITAAHCLPRLPSPGPPDTSELTFLDFLGPLGGALTVAAECLFVDPVSDLAVFGSPDNRALFHEANAYDALLESATTLPVGDMQESEEASRAFLLSPGGSWMKCEVKHFGGGLWVSGCTRAIVGGMSGSPILRPDGAVVGVISCSSGQDGEIYTEGGPNPYLLQDLPGRLMRRDGNVFRL